MTTIPVGLPGIDSARSATWNNPMASEAGKLLHPGGVIVSSISRDAQNTSDLGTLRGGVILGKITSGLEYAPSILGMTSANYTSGGTSLTVTTATAAEIVRRIGTSGTFTLVGAPTASGTVVSATVTFSAVNTGTGVLTITNIGADKVAGCLVMPTDGSQTPLGMIGTPYGVRVLDIDGNAVDAFLDEFVVGGIFASERVVNWPAATNTTLVTWLLGQLNTYGKFTMATAYQQ
jgi:hypothetical protein